MKKFKLLMGVFCLAVLVTACGGNAGKKMTSPDKVPTCKIETVDRGVHS